MLYLQNLLNLENPNSLVQIQIEPKSEFEFVLRDTEEFEFLNLVDFGDVAFPIETVIVEMLLFENAQQEHRKNVYVYCARAPQFPL